MKNHGTALVVSPDFSRFMRAVIRCLPYLFDQEEAFFWLRHGAKMKRRLAGALCLTQEEIRRIASAEQQRTTENPRTVWSLTPGQFVELSYVVTRSLPRNVDLDSMLTWINNREELKEALARALYLTAEEFLKRLDIFERQGTILPAQIEEFVPGAYFNDDESMTPCFKRMLSHAKVVTLMQETSVAFCDLELSVFSVVDDEIQAELPKGYIFESFDVLLPFLAGLSNRQQNGEVGDLLTNEKGNIFYVHVGKKVSAGSAFWEPSISKWIYCMDDGLNTSRFPGYRIFSATAVV